LGGASYEDKFLTAYPANWWLIKKGLKEKM
jgi:hypothetical protein